MFQVACRKFAIVVDLTIEDDRRAFAAWVPLVRVPLFSEIQNSQRHREASARATSAYRSSGSIIRAQIAQGFSPFPTRSRGEPLSSLLSPERIDGASESCARSRVYRVSKCRNNHLLLTTCARPDDSPSNTEPIHSRLPQALR